MRRGSPGTRYLDIVSADPQLTRQDIPLNAANSDTIDRSGISFKPLGIIPNVWLMPGVSRSHANALLMASFMSIGLITAVGNSHAYIFPVHLGIPDDEQGRLSAALAVYAEIVILSLVGFLGALSDKVGRRSIYAAGFVLLAIGYVLYPLATNVAEISAYRIVLACGAACISAMLATVLSDYPQEATRGKLVAACFFLNGVGLTIMIGTLGQMPKWFTGAGFEPVAAGTATLWIVAGACLIAAVVVARGLQPGAPGTREKGDGLFTTLKIGFSEARRPRVALSYAAGMISRGDLSVISTFLILWLSAEGRAQGLSPADAIAKAAIIFVVVQVAALFWAPVAGILIDKIDRTLALALGMVLAACGYLGVGLIPDPLGPMMYGAAVLMGIGEMSGVQSAQALVGQEAPERGRGAVIGAFSFCGALGILLAAAVGGYLFDSWRQSGPFVMMGCVNCILMVLALVTYRIAPRAPGGATTA